jgi:putative restriction endonuclease
MAAFEWLEQQITLRGEVLDYRLLQKGVVVDDAKIALVSMQGIFKPAMMEVPLSIRTSFGGPYMDSFGHDGLLKYKYRGKDPEHRDNVGLRIAGKKRIPLIYFHGVAEGKYISAWPVYVVGDDRKRLTFTIAVDDIATVRLAPGAQPIQNLPSAKQSFASRVYRTQEVKQRLHQQGFRMRVLEAYRNACAFCRLRHEELLDAAHIIPDSDPEGVPEVRNGLALCKLHHAAFDRFIVGVNPDYIIHVRKDVLEEIDGPMLKHGLQGLDGVKIQVPRNLTLKPDKALLSRRFQRFLSA